MGSWPMRIYVSVFMGKQNKIMKRKGSHTLAGINGDV